MSGFRAAGIPDLDGQTAIVTGANSGIGLATTRALAEHGARVVLGVRDQARGEAAVSGISRAEVRPLDLARLSAVRGFARDWSGPVDLLVNNAGVMIPPLTRTEDGFELQFGVNHLGHFALTNCCCPASPRRAGW
jgi:NAD(P)-dependent dehydrogenase (short-subunit alcohol dehydrogenase family)